MKRSVLLSLGLAVWPAVAGAATADEIRACTENRTGAGCATVLNRLFVCAQAPAIQGCEVLLATRETALADPEDLPDDEIEPDVTPRAEGEMADDPSASAGSGVAEDQGDGMPDADPDPATDPDAVPGDRAPATEGGVVELGDAMCPVIDSANWRAVVGAVDGAEGPHLIVTGQVTLPTPAWTVALEVGAADRSARPVQEVILTATRPDGGVMVMQVLSDYDLRLETPVVGTMDGTESPYRGVRVMCGGEMVVDLPEVTLQD